MVAPHVHEPHLFVLGEQQVHHAAHDRKPYLGHLAQAPIHIQLVLTARRLCFVVLRVEEVPQVHQKGLL